MPVWDRTHGVARGAYMAAGPNQLYVREAAGRGGVTGGWLWYVDGILMGTGDSETVARAASEAAVRAMSRTHTGAMAAPAGQSDRAA
jgi:hypothetical protein